MSTSPFNLGISYAKPPGYTTGTQYGPGTQPGSTTGQNAPNPTAGSTRAGSDPQREARRRALMMLLGRHSPGPTGSVTGGYMGPGGGAGNMGGTPPLGSTGSTPFSSNTGDRYGMPPQRSLPFQRSPLERPDLNRPMFNRPL